MIRKTGFTLVVCALVLAWSVPMYAAIDGAALYKAKCSGCHAADGTGNTPVGKALHVKSLISPEVQSQKDADLDLTITRGKGKMPKFDGKLSPDEVKAVIAIIRGFAEK